MSDFDAGAAEALFAAQKAAAPARRLSFGYAERRAALRALRDAVRAAEGEIATAIGADFGKPAPEVLLSETLPVLGEINHALRHLKRWMRPRRASPTLATLGTRARVRREPRGVSLIISPWNYPFSLALGPLVSALAAGNSAVLKPSELTPHTSRLIADLVARVFAPGLVAVVEGGAVAAEALLALPFDHVFFTGSPDVGRIVLAKAAEHLTPVTLELGGKSPAIIGPGADVKKAADWIAFGKFTNAGQTCVAPDHVFVHDDLREAFTAALRARIARSYGAGYGSAHLAGMVSARHAARLGSLIDDARAAGARLILGGEASEGRLAPTLIEAVTPEMALDNEEIFGPILPILPYAGIAGVIDRINARPKPLTLYIFDRDRAFAERIVQATSSGSVGINLTLLQFGHPGLPFGGVGRSGFGAGHGEAGFRAFSHERAVLENRASPLPLVFPPYDKRTRRLLRIARRIIG